MVLDFSEFKWLDSTGLGRMIKLLNLTRSKGGDLKLAKINSERILLIFEVTKLDEITLEKQFYSEKRKQQMEYNLEKKGLICKFLAFIPLIITIGCYLIIPFITVSVAKLLEISNEIATGK